MKSKKSKKRVIKKSAPTKKTTHEIVVRVAQTPVVKESDVTPQKEGGKYMIPKTWLSERQVVRMVQKTPAQHIYTRPGKGGQVWSYVTGNYVEKVLNFTFGWNWDFEIIEHGTQGDQVWVQGKLTVKDDHGHNIIKSQFGRADIKFKRDSKIMLDFGNDLKSASTDALKKCASLLGIASDIYGKAEFKDVGVDVQPDKPVAPVNALPEPRQEVTAESKVIKCQYPKCEHLLTPAEAQYSAKMFNGKKLCREHQDKILYKK